MNETLQYFSDFSYVAMRDALILLLHGQIFQNKTSFFISCHNFSRARANEKRSFVLKNLTSNKIIEIPHSYIRKIGKIL